MSIFSKKESKNPTFENEKKNDPEEFVSLFRSRLNVIGASMYLLEQTIDHKDHLQKKYFDTIRRELDVIREYLNE